MVAAANCGIGAQLCYGALATAIVVWVLAMGLTTIKKKIYARLRRFLKDLQAVSGTEYAILLALIVMGSMGIIGSIGSKFQVLYTIIANAVGDTM